MKSFVRFSFIFFIGGIASCQKSYIAESVPLEISSEQGKIEKGKRVALSVCGPCHYNPSAKDFSGKQMLDIPRAVGKVFASNITNNPTLASANYTSGQLKFLLKTGITKDGKFAPYMIKPNLVDEDLENIVAFLKSGDPLVNASDYTPGKTSYTPMGKLALNKLFHPLKYSRGIILRPKAFDTVALGRYLVDITGCYECHSASMVNTNRLYPELSKGYLGGGAQVKSANGKIIKTPNITFDETGIGGWSGVDFERALIDGVSPGGIPLSYPMPNYSSLTSDEINAIYKYLQTVPRLRNQVKKRSKSFATGIVTGKNLYQKYSCSNCHGPSGNGIANLNKAYQKYDLEELRHRIETPPSGSGMPSFKNIIKEEDFPYLLQYVVELGKNDKSNKGS